MCCTTASAAHYRMLWGPPGVPGPRVENSCFVLSSVFSSCVLQGVFFSSVTLGMFQKWNILKTIKWIVLPPRRRWGGIPLSLSPDFSSFAPHIFDFQWNTSITTELIAMKFDKDIHVPLQMNQLMQTLKKVGSVWAASHQSLAGWLGWSGKTRFKCLQLSVFLKFSVRLVELKVHD